MVSIHDQRMHILSVRNTAFRMAQGALLQPQDQLSVVIRRGSVKSAAQKRFDAFIFKPLLTDLPFFFAVELLFFQTVVCRCKQFSHMAFVPMKAVQNDQHQQITKPKIRSAALHHTLFDTSEHILRQLNLLKLTQAFRHIQHHGSFQIAAAHPDNTFHRPAPKRKILRHTLHHRCIHPKRRHF